MAPSPARVALMDPSPRAGGALMDPSPRGWR